ncbi:MAG TPA: right-handed parallel beta-helix repeat-containing protein, partial [Tepidisphaeraceae bacterium]|nr:right-handed parallel beta-helix repeat-containing protein [Tepidisphaeraceae bacterium]
RYELDHGLTFSAGDGGTEEAPVVYRAAVGERVVFGGGRVLPSDRFVPVGDPRVLERLAPEAREHVLCCDLRALGLTQHGQPHRPDRGRPEPLELFVDGRRAESVGVVLNGVGHVVRHCHIHDADGRAVSFPGNEHLIELCRIERVCTSGDGVGATGLGRNPSERGTVLRHNLFADIGVEPNNVTSVYLDDGTSGVTIHGNLFFRAATGVYGCVFMNGGSDNTITGNLFVDSKAGANPSDCFHSWGADRTVAWTAPETGDYTIRLKQEIDHTHPAWAARYPELVRFFDDDPATPKRVVVSGNVAVRTALMVVSCAPPDAPLTVERYLRDDNVVAAESPVAYDAEGPRWGSDGRARAALREIPLARIGLLRGRTAHAG